MLMVYDSIVPFKGHFSFPGPVMQSFISYTSANHWLLKLKESLVIIKYNLSFFSSDEENES